MNEHENSNRSRRDRNLKRRAVDTIQRRKYHMARNIGSCNDKEDQDGWTRFQENAMAKKLTKKISIFGPSK